MTIDRSHHNPSHREQAQPLDSLSPPIVPGLQRINTLKAMQHSIGECAEKLYEAHKTFIEARSLSTPELNRHIHFARGRVVQALASLHPILTLIAAAPEQVSNISICMNRAKGKLEQIQRVSGRLLKDPDKKLHRQQALLALALACPRTSFELENSLNEPIKMTQQGLATKSEITSIALTAQRLQA